LSGCPLYSDLNDDKFCDLGEEVDECSKLAFSNIFDFLTRISKFDFNKIIYFTIFALVDIEIRSNET
jgi:hypothetical protein